MKGHNLETCIILYAVGIGQTEGVRRREKQSETFSDVCTQLCERGVTRNRWWEAKGK